MRVEQRTMQVQLRSNPMCAQILMYQAYVAANERFGEVVLAHYAGGDMVWVQDYHLMLLPQMLKTEHPKMKV